jgi:hypothetical protein
MPLAEPSPWCPKPSRRPCAFQKRHPGSPGLAKTASGAVRTLPISGPRSGVEQRAIRTQGDDRGTTLPRRRELGGGGASVGRFRTPTGGRAGIGLRAHQRPLLADGRSCVVLSVRTARMDTHRDGGSELGHSAALLSPRERERRTLRCPSAPVSGHRSMKRSWTAGQRSRGDAGGPASSSTTSSGRHRKRIRGA